MRSLYNMIVRHFISTVSPDCEYITTKVAASIGSETFTAVGKRVVNPGWTALSTSASMQDTVIPEFAKV